MTCLGIPKSVGIELSWLSRAVYFFSLMFMRVWDTFFPPRSCSTTCFMVDRIQLPLKRVGKSWSSLCWISLWSLACPSPTTECRWVSRCRVTWTSFGNLIGPFADMLPSGASYASRPLVAKGLLGIYDEPKVSVVLWMTIHGLLRT